MGKSTSFYASDCHMVNQGLMGSPRTESNRLPAVEVDARAFTEDRLLRLGHKVINAPSRIDISSRGNNLGVGVSRETPVKGSRNQKAM